MSFTSKGSGGQSDRESKPDIDAPIYAPDKNPDKSNEKPTFNPDAKLQNKIEPKILPSDYTPKNKIRPHELPTNHKPRNKIERPELPPNYNQKNKIERPTLPPNYKPKNNIKPSELPPNYKPKNKIPQSDGSEGQSPKKQVLPKTGNEQPQNPKTRQKLYNDGEKKECGHCHQIKPHEEYGARTLRGEKVLFSRCKQCRIEINQIYHFKNKMKIIQNAYNGKLNGKCQWCKTDIKRLPSLEFHHSNPKLKGQKVINMNRNWEKTKRQVEKEQAMLLCINCHTKQRSKHYNNHEEIIQNNRLSHLASNNEISRYIRNRLPNADYEVRRQVLRSIKKKIVVNHVYGGKCVGCGTVNTKNNLPALQFHHRNRNNPYKMSKTYVNLRNLEINEIINKLKSDNIIVLCGSCHRMEQSSQFEENYEKIAKPEHWDQIKKDYEMIEENIKNFTFK